MPGGLCISLVCVCVCVVFVSVGHLEEDHGLHLATVGVATHLPGETMASAVAARPHLVTGEDTVTETGIERERGREREERGRERGRETGIGRGGRKGGGLCQGVLDDHHHASRGELLFNNTLPKRVLNTV